MRVVVSTTSYPHVIVLKHKGKYIFTKYKHTGNPIRSLTIHSPGTLWSSSNASSPLCFMQIRRVWVRQNTTELYILFIKLTTTPWFLRRTQVFTAYGCPTKNAPAYITTYFYIYTPVALSTVHIDNI
jgi:hypothetical protein